MKRINDMTNREIVEVLKSRNMDKSKYTGSDGKWVKRNELIALLMKPIYDARDIAMEELGKDFSKAVSFWKQSRHIEVMDEFEYPEMVDKWRILNNLVDVGGAFEVRKTAEMLKDTFCPTADISKYTQEECASFVQACVEQFQLQAFTKKLVKDSTDIIKMSKDNIQFTEDGRAVFDSTEAQHLTGQKIDYDKKNSIMRVVESSEDGISRILQDKGLISLTIFLGQMSTSNSEEEQKLIDDQKREIFTHGITDLATGKHYMFAFQNPSSCRKANFMFVEAENWDDVKALWCEVTGAKDYDELTEMLLKGKVIMAKTVARISTRGSNSFNLSKISPKWAEKIAHARIDYTKDVEEIIDRPYREQLEGGLLGDVQTGKTRTLKPGDGQMIGSFEFHALIAVGMRIISENEYTDFKVLWEMCGKDISKVKIGSRLYKLIRKIPSVFQIRHGSKKGICVRYNLEAIDRTKDIDAIVPESVRKFVDGDWSTFPLEICNYLKKKREWVALNPQFIGALQYENPNALNDIVKYWLNYAEESLNDPAKAQQFHGIIKSSDDDENETVASNLVTAMRTSSDLVNESQICNWRKDQYRKFLQDMQVGRILVPGVYSYMICDPGYLLQKTYSIEVPHLERNEYFFNGKECQCGLFRSPLIHPSEAQKVQLCNKDNYWYYHDVIVFNGYDGVWDRMGGADFDGDICAIIPDDTEFGRIVCAGIKDYGWDIVIPSNAAQKVEFTIENLIEHLVKTAHPDRTGKITNEAMTALDIANHIRGLKYFCKTFYKCETVTFIHPKRFGQDLGKNYQGGVAMSSNGRRTLCVKGFVTVSMNRYGNLKFDDTNAVIGEYNFDGLDSIVRYYEDLAGSGKVCVGVEIDGAKTGVYAEGIDGTRYPLALQMRYCAHHSIIRKAVLGKPISDGHHLNTYHSVSTLGRICDLVGDINTEGTNSYKIMEQLSNGTDKMFLLDSLLTDEERSFMNLRWSKDGVVMGLVDILKGRKKTYNDDLKVLLSEMTGEEKMGTIASRKEREANELYELCKTLNVPAQVMAVAAYQAAYDKDTKQNNALTFGWILFDELLSVFSRGNKKFELFRLPANVESVRIEAGYLYVNDRKYMPVKADDQGVAVQVINGRNYGYVRKRVGTVVAQRKSIPVVYNSVVYTIGAFGFKYHIANGTSDSFRSILAENKFECDIIMDSTNRAVFSVNGKSIAALMRTTNFELMNKRIRFVNSPNVKKTPGAYTGLQCVIIGEAQA